MNRELKLLESAPWEYLHYQDGRLCRCSCLSRGINACIFIFSAAGSCWMPSGWFSHPQGTPVTASAHTKICKTFFFWCQHYYSGKVEILHWITSSPKCDLVSLTNTSLISGMLADEKAALFLTWECHDVSPPSAWPYYLLHFLTNTWKDNILTYSVSLVCYPAYS